MSLWLMVIVVYHLAKIRILIQSQPLPFIFLRQECCLSSCKDTNFNPITTGGAAIVNEDGCLSSCKDTNFNPITTDRFEQSHRNNVVYHLAKIRILIQSQHATSTVLTSISCLSSCKDTNFNPITTVRRRCHCRNWLFIILQRYEF